MKEKQLSATMSPAGKIGLQSHLHVTAVFLRTEAARNSYLSMKVPKSSLMVFCMFSVHSQLHWSFISRHKMFKATSATAVSAAVNTNKYSGTPSNTYDILCRQNTSMVERDYKEHSANV